MILAGFILIPFVGGLLAWMAARRSQSAARWVALAAMAADLVLAVAFWIQHGADASFAGRGPWLARFDQPWIPSLGASFLLAMDGLSLLLVLLSCVLGVLSVLASWRSITHRVGFFHFNLLWSLSTVIGLFLAMDLLLFYFFWEIMLLPLYLLIGIWGNERRVQAAMKFFLYTQASGLLMLVSILGLYFVHGRDSGVWTFNYFELLHTPMTPGVAMLLMLGFFIAFAVKLPTVPLHTWLPDAHSQAPVAGNVDLAGLVLKVGAYGLLRFLVPLFPQAAQELAPVAIVLALISIIYGAVMAFAQSDLKRFLGWTSISHMGFVMLAAFVWAMGLPQSNELVLQGAVIVILAHGIGTSAMFILVGSIFERVQSREVGRMGGLWTQMPRLSGTFLFFALASMGLPALATFVGEFLVLLGTFKVSVAAAAVAASVFVASAIYTLWIVQQTLQGPPRKGEWPSPGKPHDLTAREWVMMIVSIAIMVWMGLYPRNVLDTSAPAIRGLHQQATQTKVWPLPQQPSANPADGSSQAQGGQP